MDTPPPRARSLALWAQILPTTGARPTSGAAPRTLPLLIVPERHRMDPARLEWRTATRNTTPSTTHTRRTSTAVRLVANPLLEITQRDATPVSRTRHTTHNKPPAYPRTSRRCAGGVRFCVHAMATVEQLLRMTCQTLDTLFFVDNHRVCFTNICFNVFFRFTRVFIHTIFRYQTQRDGVLWRFGAKILHYSSR